jgi:hypothetical protein
MNRLKVYIAFIALLVLTLLPQVPFASAQVSRQTRKPVMKIGGWIVPGRDDFKRESKVIKENIEGFEVTRRILESPTEIFVDVSGKTVELFARRKSDSRIFSVGGFSMYEMNGRVFAYSVSLVPIDITRRGNRYYKSYIGAMYDLFYLDEDGDGNFESRYGGLPLPKLPEWARRNV